MSDTMLLGVLRMPMDDPDPVQLMQFVGRARQAADRIEADAKEIERLRTKLTECDGKLGRKPCQTGRCMEFVRMRDTLTGIEVYATDTLSQPLSGPDDRKWYRDGIIEIVKRVRAALTKKEEPHE